MKKGHERAIVNGMKVGESLQLAKELKYMMKKECQYFINSQFMNFEMHGFAEFPSIVKFSP